MKNKTGVLAACFACAVAALGFHWITQASQSRGNTLPVELAVRGKVADTYDTLERKVFREYTARTGVRIRFAPTLRTVSEQLDFLTSLLHSHSQVPDLLDLDVIWPPTLADGLVDLKPYFKDELQDFAPELLQAFTVDNRLIALPTFVDIGVLYYRPDLLKKYGYAFPPATWDELEQMAARIQLGERSAGNTDFWGYVWQGGPYESLTCNALEWQSSSGGGTILGADGTVDVRNSQFEQSLRRAVLWIGRISPPGESAFTEDDSTNYWLAGKAAFMRNWTGVDIIIRHSTSPVRDYTAVAALPGAAGHQRGALGGSGTGISKYSAYPKQALDALRMIVSEKTQAERASGGYIPSRVALRGRPDLMDQTPLRGSLAAQVIPNVVARPASQAKDSYAQVSRAYYEIVHSVLAKKMSPEQGAAQLETELTKIMGARVSPAHAEF